MQSPAKITYNPSSEFQHALKKRVERYFRMTGRSTRDSVRMYVKSAIIMTAFVSVYVVLVFAATALWQAALLSVALGVCIAAIGFNIQHDGGHGAYSKQNWVNRIMAFSLDMVGASSYVWARKHNVLHHTYTNLAGHDDDIDLGWLARFSPDQPRHWHHRLQHIYMWVLYSVIIPKWNFRDDWSQLFSKKIGSHRLPPPKGGDLFQLVLGKIVWVSLFFVLPAILHPFLAVAMCYLIAAGTAGIIVSIVFQLAHVVEEATFPTPDPETGHIDTPWAVHEVETTADFAQGNRALSWYVGGLNFQIEHHLFPRICHVHYPKIARIVEKTCKQHGIAYHSFPTVSSAVRSHYHHLRHMGKPVPTA